MTSEQSVLWFIANAIVIVAVLTIGTLGAADLLTRRGRAEQKASTSRDRPSLDSGPRRADSSETGSSRGL